MKDRIKTLLLYADGTQWHSVAIDTLFRGIFNVQIARLVPESLLRRPHINWLLGNRYNSLSYMDDWKDAFCAAPQLDIVSCNINNLVEYRKQRRALAEFPLIIVCHSASGDDMMVLRRTAYWFQHRRGKLVVLIGNEYNLMVEKRAFLQETGADFVGSQLPQEAAEYLYSDCIGTRIVAASHGLNEKIYSTDREIPRTIDIGFAGARYPLFIGDQERTQVIEYFRQHESVFGLRCDIRFQRMWRTEWSRFLNSCHGVVGAEAGTYYLQRTDELINAVTSYVNAHPLATFEEVYERFFKSYPRGVSGKAISSRHFEPIGTHTCQILLEGRYNDILIADRHYICLKKDYSNITDVVERFTDSTYRTRITDEAYEYVMDGHTYAHRVQSILKNVLL